MAAVNACKVDRFRIGLQNRIEFVLPLFIGRPSHYIATELRYATRSKHAF